MKHLIIPLALFLAACSNWLGVPEEIEVTGEGVIATTGVKDQGGKLYIRMQAGGMPLLGDNGMPVCLIYDYNVLLPQGIWFDIDEANAFRTIPPTQIEMGNCL